MHRVPPSATFRSAVLLGVITMLWAGSAQAQSRIVTACTPDALAACMEFRFSTGSGNFNIDLRALGATGAPATPISFYNFVFGTGTPPTPTPVSYAIAPFALGNAVVSDLTPWDMFDAGDALFLTSLSNNGIGGCVPGMSVGAFGQAALTCSTSDFVRFSFVPSIQFDVRLFTLLNVEAVGLTAALPGASCGAAGMDCVIVADQYDAGGTIVPEPGTLLLTMCGGAMLLGLFTVRACRANAPRR